MIYHHMQALLPGGDAFTAKLDDLSGQGWELVSFVPVTIRESKVIGGAVGQAYLTIFRKPAVNGHPQPIKPLARIATAEDAGGS